MLAHETSQPFNSNEWIFEVKWDGYRAIAEIDKGNVMLYSRNENLFNQEYPVVVNALKKIKEKVILDGEIVVLNEHGKPDFGKLHDYRANQQYQLVYYVFDILFRNNQDLCNLPLTERKKILREVIEDNDVIKYSDHIEEDGISFFEAIKEMDMEGIMAKKADSSYYPGKRTSNWLKIKKHGSHEGVIVGYTAPTGARKYFGSLAIAFEKEGKLVYAGNVGTGFNDELLKEIFDILEPLKTDQSPFTQKIPTRTPITWVKPKIHCEIKYSELTKDGIMRHPVFVQLTLDRNLTTDKTMITPPVAQEKDKKLTFGNIEVQVTNLNKVFFPEENITKGMIIDYYLQMADYILPYLKDRPESLKRNPNGINDKGFFHKDVGDEAPKWVDTFTYYSESTKRDIDFVLCNNKPSLAYLANLGCIELNPWHSTIHHPENPDYLIIDIDPAEKNTFDQVVETAQAVKTVLDQAEAISVCKTSGATGLHVYIPLQAQYDYTMAKDFAHLICVLAHEYVKDFTSLERSLDKRGNNIYLDFLQNRSGQTIASVYSARPRPGATVSTPLAWDEVKKGLDPKQFDIFTVPERVKKTGDLFKLVLGQGVDIEKCLKKLNNE